MASEADRAQAVEASGRAERRRSSSDERMLRDAADCLCCHHFSMDLETIPEAVESKRPSRRPKNFPRL